MKIWIDDARPAPEGWVHVRNMLEAIELFKRTDPMLVEEMSLDHDLGMCGDCVAKNGGACFRQCVCPCHHDGSSLVDWMEETDWWPPGKPRVHSANPVGRQYMQLVIDVNYNRRHL